ncbi:hypothetical protein V5E97_04710 [Singulisphaera sp. Ch08]|uniref:Uncharacterized protein n=1 Tax=Singulisphaera sp. Ch08 TaxID=3120278 RepID=A0AAU7CJ78_9BACT
MADISINFHALPQELLSFLRQIAADFGLHIVALNYRPFDAHKVPHNQLDNYFTLDSPYRRFHLSLGEPVLPVKHELDFGDQNPNSLRLDVGTLNENGLEESWLSARTHSTTDIATWKKIARRLKGLTVEGATAFNPKTGLSGPSKKRRFTEGALKLVSAGTTMRSITGIHLIPFEDYKKPQS